MTSEEVIRQIKECHSKILTLGEEVRNESDLDIILSKIAEMTELRQHAYSLTKEYFETHCVIE